MTELHVLPVAGEATARDWQHVHNVIIPADPLSLADVRERAQRNHLEVAYVGGELAGCTTVRPPAPGGGAATVIVRVLAEHRRQGLGRQLYDRCLDKAHELGAKQIETIVWESNLDGLRFAEASGFLETERYLPEGEQFAYITLRLP